MEEILTLQEAARYLKVAPITLYRMARRGVLPAVKFGRSWRFPTNQLEEWLHRKANPQEPTKTIDTFRYLSTRESNGLLKFIGLLKSRYSFKLGRVILYGSRARGDFKAYSDIDLLIILKAKQEELEKTKKEIGKITNEFNMKEGLTLQTFSLSEEEWEKPSFKSFLLVENIRREGMTLYG